MEKTTNYNILQAIENVLLHVHSDAFLHNQQLIEHADLNKLCATFQLQPTEMIVLCLIAEASIHFEPISSKDLLRVFGDKISRLKPINDALELLIGHGYVFSVSALRSMKPELKNQYRLDDTVLEAILSDDVQTMSPKKVNTFADFMSRFTEIYAQRSEGEFDAQTFQILFKRTLSSAKLIEEVKWLSSLEHITDTEMMMFFILVHYYSEKHEGSDLDYLISEVEDHKPKKKIIKSKLLNGTSGLLKNELIQVEESDMVLDEYIKITPKALRKLFPQIAIKESKSVFETATAMMPKDIKYDTLYYNPKEREQIDTLYRLLDKKKFNALVKKLKENNISEGVCILFDGFSGTGKTATAYRLAKETSRAIFHVNTEKIIDKWLGNAEKNVKKIFTEYQEFSKKCAQTPILLFNEDSIFSNRVQVGASVDRTHNSMQNILLEQMEQFQGILMVTTNASEKMDKAYERRFLYRIFFEKPSHETQMDIFSNAFPEFERSQISSLLHQFSFTGGQIHNIKKKYFIQSVLQPKQSKLELLRKLCAEEVCFKMNSKVGF